MNEADILYREMGISEKVLAFGAQVESELKVRFEAIDENTEYNQMKVLHAMQKNRVEAACFASTSGYGYNDLGRDKLEAVYADVFHTEAALVRPQIACGRGTNCYRRWESLMIRWKRLSESARPQALLQNMELPTARWIFWRTEALIIPI